jgi:hypothetical protein
MAYTLLLHISNEDPVVVECERFPEPTDTCIVGMHPRRKDNKEVHYILPDVTTVVFPMWRINFIEVMPSGEEEEVFKPFRE